MPHARQANGSPGSLTKRSAKIGYRWIFDPQLHETIRDTGPPRRSQVARARDAGVGEDSRFESGINGREGQASGVAWTMRRASRRGGQRPYHAEVDRQSPL
jgi:hypothetical protein